MKRFIKISLLFVTVAALLLSGCVKQDDFEQKQVVEGDVARVKLSLISPEPKKASSRAALDDAEEPNINNLQVIVVNKFGAVVTSYYDANPPIPLDVLTVSGNDMKIYVIANAGGRNDINLQSELDAVKSETELKAIIQNLSSDNAITREMLLATGMVSEVNLQPGSLNLISEIQLYYVSSRIDFTVIDATTIVGDKFEAISWDVVNVPVKSYVIGTTTDAVDNSEADDFHYTAGFFSFDDVTTLKQWKSSFYTFENRQGGRVPNAGTPSAGYTPGAINSGSDKDKAWYAPAKATYILINGIYTKEGKTSVQNMKIYLGQDAHSNYDLERGKRYTVTITVKGRNDVKIDSNIEDINSDHEVQTSSNLDMDAHPDFRIFRIAGSAKNGVTSKATIEILDENGKSYDEIGFNAKWLKVSPLNLYRHQVKQGATGGSMQQQQLASDAFFVRPRYVPHKSWRDENSSADWGWGAIIGSEADDDMLPFDEATYRMCYKITDIPFANQSAVTFQAIQLYADEYTGAGSRFAKVKITYDDGAGFVDTEIFAVSQQGAIVGTNLSIENFEEAGMILTPGQATELQSISTMQWGYSSTLLNVDDVNRYSFGAYNTAFTIYSTTVNGSETNLPSWTNDEYRTPMWPYTGAAINSYGGGNSGFPYFNPVIGIAAIHPIYNSSATRYCHEKNRDLNGDGIIDQSETFWYLPSFADLWSTRSSISGISASLWTSSEESNTNAWVFNSANITANSVPKSGAYRVRCVRGLGAALLGQATIASREADDNTKINFSIGAGQAQIDVFDPNGEGLTWRITSSAPSWLSIKASASGTDGVSSGIGVGNRINASGYYVYAKANTGAYRTAYITLSRPGQPSLPARRIRVTQMGQLQNLRAFPGIVAYDPGAYNPGMKSDVGMLKLYQTWEEIPPQAMTVYFKFGSVIGIASGRNGEIWNDDGSAVVFNHTNNSYTTWATINTAGNSDITNLFHIENRANGLGDPCRIVGLTKDQILAGDQSGWRLPTISDNDTFVGQSNSYLPGSDWTTGTNNPYNFDIAGVWLPKGSQDTWLPAAGYRDNINGTVINQGVYGYYWSSIRNTASSGYYLGFFDINMNPRGNSSQPFSFPVRCVQ